MLANFKCEFSTQLICALKTPLKSDIWVQRYGQFFYFSNNARHKNLSPFSVYKSKSILATSNSFPLIDPVTIEQMLIVFHLQHLKSSLWYHRVNLSKVCDIKLTLQSKCHNTTRQIITETFRIDQAKQRPFNTTKVIETFWPLQISGYESFMTP